MGYGADVADFMDDHGIADLHEACELFNDAGDDTFSHNEEDPPHGVELVNTEERCRTVCTELLKEEALAVDIEGVTLCRHGEICILQAATCDGSVFLFDVEVLGAAAFDSGLREVLESEHVEKLFYDCRADSDALYHRFGVEPCNVLDLQVLRDKSQGAWAGRVDGLAKVLKDMLSPDELQEADRVKAAGLALFAPEKGGSHDVWKRRPLPDALLEYCAQDVHHLFAMRERWGGCLPTADWRTVSERRMANQIHAADFVRGPHRAVKDFKFTAEWLRRGPKRRRIS